MESKSEKFVPYIGVRPFVRSEGELFSGREKETRQIVNLIFANSVLLVYSKSGAGKTSLLNAKVIPMLKEKGFEVLCVGVAGEIPQDIKSNGVRNIYVFNTISSCAGAQVDLRRFSERTLAEYLKERKYILNHVGRPLGRVLIFDQFEELFVCYPDQWENRKDFFEQIEDALEQDHLLRVVFSLREDYLGEVEPYITLLRGKLQARFHLENLCREGALAAVKNPLLTTDRTFAEGVAEKIVDDLMRVRIPTPEGHYIEKSGQFIEPSYLQVVLSKLWDNLPRGLKIITEDYVSYAAPAGVDNALSDFYDRAIQSVVQTTGVTEGMIRRWFDTQLITPGGTRGSVFQGKEYTGGIPNYVIEELVRDHLIQAEMRAGARWYELPHDRLIQPIQESNKTYYRKTNGVSS